MSKNDILSNMLWKLAESVLAQMVSLVVSIVLARLLLPEDYGLIAIVTVFITVANVFVTSGIPNALIQKKDASNQDFSSVFFFNLVFSAAIYCLLFVGAPLFSQFYNEPQLVPVIRVLGLQIVVAAVQSVQSAYVSKNMIFRKYFWSTLTGMVLSGIVGIVMAYMGFGVWALVAQQLTNTTVGTVVLFFTIDWKPIRYFSWKRIASLLKFGWKILFESVSNSISTQLSSLVIGRVYTAGELGFYTKAQQFPNIITTNVGAAVNAVLFPAIANEQDNAQRVIQLLRKSVRVTSYVVFPLLMGLAVVAEPLICLLMTEKWVGCVPYLQIFCLNNAVIVGLTPRHQALNGIGRSDVFMYEHLFARILSLILLIVVHKISIMAIAISIVVSMFVNAVIVMYTSKRYSNYSYSDQIKDVIPTIIGCVIMGVCVYPISLLNLPNVVILVIQVSVGVIVYAGYSFVFKLEEFNIIKGFLLRFLKRKK